jgi:hypothetical protein
LDEKGKKYGSFNPTSVNSFCPVAGGVGTHLRWGILTRPQVGDFKVAIGDKYSNVKSEEWIQIKKISDRIYRIIWIEGPSA